MTTMSNVLVCFHSDNDGYAAAAAAYEYFSGEDGWLTNHVEFFPSQYGKEFPMDLVTAETEVYVLDFSWPRAVMDVVAAKVKKLVVLDHHKTAQADMGDAPYAIFDMSKSGNVLACEYFFPDTPVSEFDLLIQDRDLWTKKFGDRTEALSSFVWSAIQKARNPAMVLTLLITLNNIRMSKPNLDACIKIGMVHLEIKASQIGKYKSASNWFMVQTEYGIAKVANVIENISDAAEVMYTDQSTKSDYVMTYQVKADVIVFSLRSLTIDVSVIAKAFGGGGHKAAAGFVMTLGGGFAYLTKLSNERIVNEAT